MDISTLKLGSGYTGAIRVNKIARVTCGHIHPKRYEAGDSARVCIRRLMLLVAEGREGEDSDYTASIIEKMKKFLSENPIEE